MKTKFCLKRQTILKEINEKEIRERQMIEDQEKDPYIYGCYIDCDNNQEKNEWKFFE